MRRKTNKGIINGFKLEREASEGTLTPGLGALICFYWLHIVQQCFVAAVDVRGRPGSFHSKHKYNNPGER